MASVQFPPGVKHTVTAEGVVVVLGHRAGGAGVGVDEDALRGLPARQYSLSGHWSHRPLSPQTYLPVSDEQLWSPWQGSWCAYAPRMKPASTTRKSALMPGRMPWLMAGFLPGGCGQL